MPALAGNEDNRHRIWLDPETHPLTVTFLPLYHRMDAALASGETTSEALNDPAFSSHSVNFGTMAAGGILGFGFSGGGAVAYPWLYRPCPGETDPGQYTTLPWPTRTPSRRRR
ncbi:hypothetical protein RQP46_002829 [Phenoliferia psychrophenolica]